MAASSSVVSSEMAEMAPEDGDSPGLRSIALSGGAYLMIREIVGMMIRLGGVVIVTRIIGPADYGIYVGVSAFVAVISLVAQFGSEVWLIRQPEEPSLLLYQQVWTLVLSVSLVITGLTIAVSFAARAFVPEGTLVAFRVLALSIPINVIWAPAQAKIERGFGYRKMAWLELAGDFALYGTALPLALLGLGVYSLVVGYMAWQLTLLVGSSLIAHLPPRLRWSRAVARELLHHGSSYASTGTVSQLTTLASPIFVGIFAGSAAVGFVGLASRLVDTAGFAMRTTYRLALVMMTRLREDRERLRDAISEGLAIQLIGMGAPMAVFALVARQAIPLVWGNQWRPSIPLYGVLAVSQLLTSFGQVPSVYLLSVGRNITLLWLSTLNLGVLYVGAAVAVPFLGGMGLAIASVLDAAVWVVSMDLVARRAVGFEYKLAAPWFITFASLVLFPVWRSPGSYFLLLPLVVISARSKYRRVLWSYATYASATFRNRFVVSSGPDAKQSATEGKASAVDDS